MVTFETDRAIYLQIYDRICDEVLAGTLTEEGRIPSVREYSAYLQVNNNTTVKAFDELSRGGIIQNRRGMGFYVCRGARGIIMEKRREIFIKKTLTSLFKQMSQLGITMEEVVEEYKAHASEQESDTRM